MASTRILVALTLASLASADVITSLSKGVVYNGRTSGVRYLSLLGDTANKLISTSFAAIDQCPRRFGLSSPCVTFKLAPDGQLDDMSDHPGATPRQRNFVGSPDIDHDTPSTVLFTMMLQQASAQPGFFHLAQVIADDGPVWTMSIVQSDSGDTVDILDADGNSCSSMPLSLFLAGPMAVSVALHPEEQKMYWSVTDIRRRKNVMACRKAGNANLGKSINVQGGAYRRVLDDGLTKPAIAHVGKLRVIKNRFARYSPKKKASA